MEGYKTREVSLAKAFWCMFWECIPGFKLWYCVRTFWDYKHGLIGMINQTILQVLFFLKNQSRGQDSMHQQIFETVNRDDQSNNSETHLHLTNYGLSTWRNIRRPQNNWLFPPTIPNPWRMLVNLKPHQSVLIIYESKQYLPINFHM